MSIKFLSVSAAALAMGAFVSSNARAVELGLDLELGKRKPPVVIQPAPEVSRRWIPETVIHKEERVLVQPQRVDRREERVLVEPARFIKKEERVLIHPERIEKRTEQVLVRPARIEHQWVPTTVREDIKIGPVRIEGKERGGYYRDVEVPAVYENVVKEVVIPAKYDIVFRDVEIPARYEKRVVEVPVPPRYESVHKDVVVPGHWEETVVTPPPVVVQPPKRGGLEFEVDINKRR